jgi:uncharacterized damage-inducible protein DinB
MSELAMIIDELQRIHTGEAWHGPALRDLLSGVTAEQAAARPVPGGHSIWELVLHIAAWEEVFRNRLEGQPAKEPQEGDFPPIEEANQQAWPEALAYLDSTHEQLLKTVSGLSDGALLETVVGQEYSVGFMLHGIVRHQVYHAGQIGLLKKLCR